MEKYQTNKLEHVPGGSKRSTIRNKPMFELLNDDLEEAIDILRRMQTANGSERWSLLGENQIRSGDIEKTVELCHLLCYYYERVKESK